MSSIRVVKGAHRRCVVNQRRIRLPADVEMEDRLAFGLTARQLVILAATALVCYGVFAAASSAAADPGRGGARGTARAGRRRARARTPRRALGRSARARRRPAPHPVAPGVSPRRPGSRHAGERARPARRARCLRVPVSAILSKRGRRACRRHERAAADGERDELGASLATRSRRPWPRHMASG